MYASVMAPAGPQMSSEDDEDEDEEQERRQQRVGTHVMPHSLNPTHHGVLIFRPLTLYYADIFTALGLSQS